MWPYLAIAALAGLVVLHFWWRGRWRRLRQQHAREIARLQAEARAATARGETRLRTLFDSMTEGVLLLNREGRVQLANRRFTELFDLGAKVAGRTVLEATRSHEMEELAASAARSGQWTGRTLRLPGSPERHVEVNAAPIGGTGTEREGLLVVLHDVTRLRQLENTRQEFVANVSHELRTPLSLIKGYAETLLDGAHEDPTVREKFLGTIHRNAQRLELLIEDLLTISSLESGQVRLDPEPVALRPLVERMAEDFSTRAQTRDAHISVEVPDLTVRADAGRLQQVLGNLLDNAVKYGRAGGRITIGARAVPEGWVEVCVGDDGPGIPSDALDRIFERFYRVDKARSREQGGTGLGLSIVKHIVKAHGGKVWAESELGNGTRVFFTVPAAT